MQIGKETSSQTNLKNDYAKFTREEASKYLGVSLVSIDRAIAKRKISFFRIGRRVIFGRHHLDEFLTRNEVVANIRNNRIQYSG